MSVWYEDEESYLGLGCNHVPECIHCKANPNVDNADMELFDAKLLNFSLENKGRGEKNSYAIDVVMYCPRCGWYKVYGVAVSEEHGLRAREKAQKLMEPNRNG